MLPRPELEAAALGLVQGAAELLPVSSSAHVGALPWLLGWECASWPAARRKELEVALHFGAAVALAPALLRALPDARTLALSFGPPAVLGYGLEQHIEERLGTPTAVAGGLLAGAAALAAADRAPQRRGWARANGAPPPYPAGRWPAPKRRPGVPVVDALLLGLAQAAALAPGVSRAGATLAAARARGYDRPAASALSLGVSGPVLAGATALKAARIAGRRAPWAERRVALVGAAAAFAATRAAVHVIGTERRRPLWPYAAERAALAGAILAVRHRRRR
jgi:undecaprenyl-diphosphatase